MKSLHKVRGACLWLMLAVCALFTPVTGHAAAFDAADFIEAVDIDGQLTTAATAVAPIFGTALLVLLTFTLVGAAVAWYRRGAKAR